jgi:hypothetical protein
LNLFFHVVEIVLSDRKTLVADGYKVIEADACLFKCLTYGAVDVCLSSVLMSFGEGPLLGFSALNEEDGIAGADTDGSIDLLGTCFVATECLGE